MANATKGVPTPERENAQGEWPVAAGAKIFEGTIVGSTMVSTTRYARVYVAGDVILGVATKYVDNSIGANGDVRVKTKRGSFRFQQNATITDAHTDLFCKPVDNQTIAVEAVPATVTANTLGRIVEVTPEGVWVELRRHSF